MKWVYIAFALLGGLVPGAYLFSRFRVNAVLDDVDLLLLSFGLGLLAAPVFFGLAVVLVRLLYLLLRFLRGVLGNGRGPA